MQTCREIQREIAEWASRNFCYIDKIGLGIGEELGEYLHDTLKSRQRIRSHYLVSNKTEGECKAELDEKLKDCIGDCMIYVLHYAEVNGTFVSFEEGLDYAQSRMDYPEFTLLSFLFTNVSRILAMADVAADTPRVECQRTFNNLCALAKIKGYGNPIKRVLMPTWNMVKQRDWIKYPKTGRPEIATVANERT